MELHCQIQPALTTTKAPDRAANVARARRDKTGWRHMGSPTFQPRFGEDSYPIGRFILGRARTLGISRSDLVRRLHHRDLGSGHKALSALLLSGEVSDHIAKHLAEALEIDDALLGSVIGATTRQKRDEAGKRRVESERAYRGSFRPHLQVQIERAVPSPIFMAALLTVKRLRVVPLPDEALTANDEAQDRIIKTIIIDHWRENGGRVPAFGGITGYVLVSVVGYGGFDFGLPFGVTGDRAGTMQKVERLGQATLGTRRGDMSLTGLLKNSPILVRAGENELAREAKEGGRRAWKYDRRPAFATNRCH
jgi:hypothetical protein